jgi:hypothetical protein
MARRSSQRIGPPRMATGVGLVGGQDADEVLVAAEDAGADDADEGVGIVRGLKVRPARQRQDREHQLGGAGYWARKLSGLVRPFSGAG